MNLRHSQVSPKAVAIGAVACLIFVVSFFVFQALSGKIISPKSNQFGIGIDTGSATSQVGVISSGINANESIDGQPSIGASLVSYPQRNISESLSAIFAKKEENERIRQELARIDELNHIARAKNNRQHQIATVGLPPLSEVNWDVGRVAFVNEWTSRIDKYLTGTPLAGLGRNFAEAAWEVGIDPRWSPAISNTESGNGKNCFLPHNAWGWGASSWPDWPTAINEHVKGLAELYGYSLSYPYAAKYCPPNTDYWYNNTLSQMATI